MFEKMADDHKKQADLRNELKAQKLAKSAEQRAAEAPRQRAAAAATPSGGRRAPPPEKRPLAPDAPHAPPRSGLRPPATILTAMFQAPPRSAARWRPPEPYVRYEREYAEYPPRRRGWQ
ncbi:hypothetical protein JL720_17207 [Aureococcus anophagefferens]|nr:hypothetical protein JL720_17207 [Aureococcus anophagefferens]